VKFKVSNGMNFFSRFFSVRDNDLDFLGKKIAVLCPQECEMEIREAINSCLENEKYTQVFDYIPIKERSRISLSEEKKYLYFIFVMKFSQRLQILDPNDCSGDLSHLIKKTLDYSIFYSFSSQVTTRNYQ
jgi:hypothetical protein